MTDEELQFRISVDGRAWYESTANHGLGGNLSGIDQETHFHGEDYLVAELEITGATGGFVPYAAVLKADDGAFSRMGAGIHRATAGWGSGSVFVTFGDAV